MIFDFTNKSVAVVGSSGYLLERDYATFIDNHDIVIRFNFARVEGYEKFVGTKTTYRIVNHHVFLGTTSRKRFPLADPNFIPTLPKQTIILVRKLNGNLKHRSPNNEVMHLSDKNWNEYKELLGNKKDPSAGFLGVMMSISAEAKQIDVFGFDQSNTLELTKRHYWEDVTHHFNGHDYNPEREVFDRLEKTNTIQIYR